MVVWQSKSDSADLWVVFINPEVRPLETMSLITFNSYQNVKRITVSKTSPTNELFGYVFKITPRWLNEQSPILSLFISLNIWNSSTQTLYKGRERNSPSKQKYFQWTANKTWNLLHIPNGKDKKKRFKILWFSSIHHLSVLFHNPE